MRNASSSPPEPMRQLRPASCSQNLTFVSTGKSRFPRDSTKLRFGQGLGEQGVAGELHVDALCEHQGCELIFKTQECVRPVDPSGKERGRAFVLQGGGPCRASMVTGVRERRRCGATSRRNSWIVRAPAISRGDTGALSSMVSVSPLYIAGNKQAARKASPRKDTLRSPGTRYQSRNPSTLADSSRVPSRKSSRIFVTCTVT